MSRSDRRLALEPLEAADADTVRGSTLISQIIICDAVQSPENRFCVGWLPIPGESSGGAAPPSARGLQQSSLESAFSRYIDLPEGARPEARAASNRAV